MTDIGGLRLRGPDARGLRGLALAAFVVLVLVEGYRFVRAMPLVQDERVHHNQVVRFARGRFVLNRDLTTLPGYHAVLAVAAKAAGDTGRRFLRGVQAALALVCVAVFHHLAKRLRGGAAGRTTLQFFTLPLVFPFFFLLYTDVLALLFVLGALAMAVEGRTGLAGLVGTLGILVRQTNAVWLAFVCGFVFVQMRSGEHGQPGVAAPPQPLPQRLVPWLRECRVALAGLLAFVAFVVWNRGVAVGDQVSHPIVGPHLTNVWLLLAFGTALLLPAHVAEAGRVVRHAAARPRETLAGLAAALLLYWLTFTNTHPYNADPAEYLHNALLVWATSSAHAKLLFFVPVAWALLWLRASALPPVSAAVLGAATLALLGSTWLVEPRYYAVPLALFLLLRRPGAAPAEAAVVAQNAVLSAWLLWGIRDGRFFP